MICVLLCVSILIKRMLHKVNLYPLRLSSRENVYFLVCDGFNTVICSNETLPWDVVDGFSKERCSLRYFRILIQTQKVLHALKVKNTVISLSLNNETIGSLLHEVKPLPYQLCHEVPIYIITKGSGTLSMPKCP